MIRYPGGKSKLRKQITSKLKERGESRNYYVEPFVGGGSVLFELLRTSSKSSVLISDKDIGIASLWLAIRDEPEVLKRKILEFKPSVEKFYLLKEQLEKQEGDFIDLGFSKLAIHQLSYSGLGLKSGGPLGGKDQKSKYKIDCRWSPKYIAKKVDEYSPQLKNTTIVAENYEDVLDDSSNIILYLDPPYYKKGNELYYHGFSQEDHENLAQLLKKLKYSKWVLSYDDCEEIRELYREFNIEEINTNYTINTSRNKVELLIWN